LLDMNGNEKDREIIKASVTTLDRFGPDYWTGYSYSWLGNMKARLFDGEGAAEALKIFAKAFVLKNSFHVNGDQTKSGYSKFTYRPFTLEGNFAFASGIQDMLMQSHTGTIRVMPAIPASWQNVSFSDFRAQGAFLVSATMKEGEIVYLKIRSEKGGKYSFYNPFKGKKVKIKGVPISDEKLKSDIIEHSLPKGKEMVIEI